MAKFTVFLNAFASATVEVEADNPEEAFKKAIDETDGYAEAEFSDWDYESGEVEDEDGKYHCVEDFKEEV